METNEKVKAVSHEKDFCDKVYNGFFMLIVCVVIIPLIMGITTLLLYEDYIDIAGSIDVVLFIIDIILLCGFCILEPNEARVMVYFGEYRGTFRRTGFFWVHPFMSTKSVSLRARNLDVDPIKVNDRVGNPILIGMMMVWRLKDTYKAMFEIDAQTLAGDNVNVGKRMKALEDFVRVQSDAALRQVAGQYAYDNEGRDEDELTLRGGGDEINAQLEHQLTERLTMAGIEVVEARINYIAYAPEIAAVMLRRQQASAIISAREKIVEGAVSMVKMALDKLSEEEVVELDEEKKAAMVSNLLVVLCADEPAQPVINSGTLNH
jgi:regulator of protease activity HflC (stomatin/prohibitin superfamily)